MAKIKNKKRNQVIALFAIAIVSVIGLTLFLYRNEIGKALNNQDNKVIKEAGWDSNVDFGEVDTLESDNSKQSNLPLKTLKDKFGNEYEVYNVYSIGSTLPLFTDEDWAYDICNDAYIYMNKSEKSEYKGMQICVIPLNKFEYTDLYNARQATEEYLSKTLGYFGKQAFKPAKLHFNNADNSNTDDEYLKYEPSYELQSIKNDGQYLTKYLQVQYFNGETSKMYIICGIGTQEQEPYISQIMDIIRQNCKEITDMPQDAPYLNKVETIGEYSFKLPNRAVYYNKRSYYIGRLADDAKCDLYNICFLKGVFDSSGESLSSVEKAYIMELLYYRAYPADLYETYMSEAKINNLSINEIERITLDDGDVKCVYQVYTPDIPSLHQPIYIYCYRKTLENGKTVSTYTIGSVQKAQLASTCAEMLNTD